MSWSSVIGKTSMGIIGLISSLFSRPKRDDSALEKMRAEAAKKKQTETDKLANIQQRGRRSRKRRSVLSDDDGSALQQTLG